MHELPVTQNLLELTLAKAREAGAGRVTEIHLIIGDLSSFIDDSIRFYWDLLAEGTLAEGAELHFKRVPIKMLCHDCNQRYRPEPGQLLCPQCNGAQLTLLAGDEFQLEYIVIDEAMAEETNREKVN